MSRVFVADEVRLGRKVVVKVLSPELAEGLSAERFEREIRIVAALQQANIVPVLTAGDTDGLPFYTMPFVEGESLRAHLAGGPLAITEVVTVMKDVSKALAYAHQRGVVHRDIKPDNVLLSGGTAVVTDFGIAKAITAARTQSGAATLTQIGTSIGTPAYMAPEQAAGDSNIDHRADIYALGAMVYELLAGQPVFAGRTAQRMLAAHLAEAPRPIVELRADAPGSLADLVMRCLEKDPDARPQTAGDIVRLLETMTSASDLPAMPPVLLGGPGVFRKALAIYVAAFALVAIAAKGATVAIGLPDWVFPGALVVMALGLPVVLWTGYVQRVTRRATTATPTFTPGGTRAEPARGTIATIALRAAPHVSWYRTARGGIYAFGVFVAMVAAFMITRALGVGPFGSLAASGRLSRRDQILLTDFRTTNVDTTLGRVVSDAVRAGLAGSSAFTLVPGSVIVSALKRMTIPPTTRVDSSIARAIAQREGFKAIVDGDVTGVPGGYIVSIRLVRADSGVELASFRESGDGPRGLIDAADKLSRSLRAKAGESLRSVNATPPLSQATTSSLDALRKYSESVRANLLGDNRSIALTREALAIDSTFASAWSGLGALLSNYGGTRSAIDSALTQAYRYRDRLPVIERDGVIARFYALGPGRDRAKAISAYESLLQRGDSGAVPVNLAEMLRTRRDYARAESLNVLGAKTNPGSATGFGNATEMLLDQGKVGEAAAMAARIEPISPWYGSYERTHIYYARGEDSLVRSLADSLARKGEGIRHTFGQHIQRSMLLRDGHLAAAEQKRREMAASRFGAPLPDDSLYEVWLDEMVRGPSPALDSRLDAVIAAVPFHDLPMVDRPYLFSAVVLARGGNATKARAMIARYRTEMTDTSLRRAQEAELHTALGEIGLAERKPQDALVEFRRGDISYDGLPADECGACLPFNLARAFDAAGKSDSAVVMFERYLSTPYWLKIDADMDPVRLPAVHERLGQLYESMGNTDKAVQHYRAFIELWKNADADLQPRVADARKRLARLTPVEKPRP